MKTDEQLKQENPELYRVARLGGTEPAFKGKYFASDEKGVFHCAVCDAPLFSSDTKFSSGSGWPSFTDPVNKEAVTLHQDVSHGMLRTEVKCKTCDAHLGHVFADGPKKEEGGVCDRFCINGISLELQENNTK